MMAVKSNLCFSTFVFGTYQKYIPYYIYSIAKTYPESFTKVIIEDKLDLNIFEVLNLIKKKINYSFEIIELNTSFSHYEKFVMRGSGAKTMVRWLFDSSYFQGFEYVYIGDVDILFLREKMPLLELHIQQMNSIKAPFSNKVRVDKEGNLTTRLTGLHFLKTEEYFNKIDPIIHNLLDDETYLNGFVEGLERNEDFLYKLNMKAFQFDPKYVSTMQRPWHGLHLGITRGNKDINLKTIEENSSLSLNEIKKNLSNFQRDPIYQKIQDKVFLMELYVILKHLKVSIPLSWKLKAIVYNFKNLSKSFKKKIKRLVHV